MNVLGNGAYAIADEIGIDAEGVSQFVFGRGWLLEIIKLTAGEYYFVADGREIRPSSSRFGVFYPSFTIVRCFVKNMKGRLAGIGSIHQIEGLPDTPLIFETDHEGPLTDVQEAVSILETSRNSRSIELNPHCSPVSIKAKGYIDANFSISPSISRVAAALGVSHSHLSRRFKHDLGMSPSNYLHRLRVAEATFRLSTGEPIIEASMDAGYNDLSRFYTQFRKTTRVSPGACRSMLDEKGTGSKNAKTVAPISD